MLKQALTNDRQTDRQAKDRGETDTKRQIKEDSQRQTDRQTETENLQCQNVLSLFTCPALFVQRV